MRRLLVLALCALLTGCASTGTAASPPAPAAEPDPLPTSAPASDAALVMPDLVGLPSTEAQRVLGDLQADGALQLWSSWERPVTVGCRMRPGTVAWQRPAPGAELTNVTEVRIRTAALDLARFRGPCHPPDGNRGPVRGQDSDLAAGFYRFASDPSLGAPFAFGPVWVGLEDGPTSVLLEGPALADLAKWEIGKAYAERAGPFSALDTLASSGGYYEVHDGIATDCSPTGGTAPSDLTDLRAISLTSPADVTSACMEFWAVTLFLDGHDEIRGVALRLGSP